MGIKNNGREFEKLTESIFRKFVKNPRYEKVEHNVNLKGIDGPRQIDVLISCKSCGINFVTVVECKDYNSKISVGTIDAFHSKLQDVKANKGILVAKRGFSSTAISKAKRLGITLCTAEQVLNKQWSLDIDFPILLEVTKPISFDFEVSADLSEGDKIDLDSLIINGIDLTELLKRKWQDGSLGFLRSEKEQKIYLDELTPPYKIKINNEQEDIRFANSFAISAKFDTKYYLTELSKLDGTQILKNITEESTSIFFDIKSIRDVNEEFKEVSKTTIDSFNGMHIEIRISGNFSASMEGILNHNT
tara:strand:+ start:919 stop:1830 length:912 start_codon:yes stop_codon:yes gene_type:complete